MENEDFELTTHSTQTRARPEDSHAWRLTQTQINSLCISSQHVFLLTFCSSFLEKLKHFLQRLSKRSEHVLNIMTDLISESLQKVRQNLADAERAAGRPAGSVRLLAVSKTFHARDIKEAYRAGQRDFGESYVQELQHKAETLATLEIKWHFIGSIQSNKTHSLAKLAHWAHSVDRLNIAQRLSTQRPPGLPPLNVCIQVNVSGEANKRGCTSGQLFQLACAVDALPRIALRGLMCIPARTADPERLTAQFTQLRSLSESLITKGFALDTLSMGMSSDMLTAVAEGATMVRMGTAIFGPRHQASWNENA